MTLFIYALFVFFGPIINVFLPNIFGDINLIWFIFYFLLIIFIFRQTIIKKTINAPNLWILIIAFFYFIILASISWSENYSYDISTMKRIFAHYFVPLVIAFISFNIIKNEEDIHQVVLYVLASAMILSFLSIFQMLFGYQTLFQEMESSEAVFRSSGTFSNPNGLAIFLVLCIPYILYGWDHKIISSKFNHLSLLCISGGIICTVSRKGILTAFLTLFMYFFFKKNYKYLFVFLFLSFLAAGTISAHSLMSQRFTSERLATQFEGKANMAKIGIKMFLEKPLIGFGYQGYYENFGKYFPNAPKQKYDSHNMYATVLANTGLLGFLPFMAIFLYPALISILTIQGRLTQYNNDMAIICIISITTFMLNGFYAGGLIDFYPIMMLFYTNISLVFSCRYCTGHNNLQNKPVKGV